MLTSNRGGFKVSEIEPGIAETFGFADSDTLRLAVAEKLRLVIAGILWLARAGPLSLAIVGKLAIAGKLGLASGGTSDFSVAVRLGFARPSWTVKS